MRLSAVPAIATLAAAALALPTSGAVAAEGDVVTAVRAARIFDGEKDRGAGVLTLREGRIVSLAAGGAGGAGLLDLGDAWITPGWVDASSRTGIAGADAEESREVTPCVRPLRVFDPAALDVRRALREGVTSLFLAPGDGNVVGGLASVVKTAPAEDGSPRVVAEAAALKIAFGSEPSRGNFPARGIPFSIYARRPTTRMGVLAVLRDAWILGRAAGPDATDADTIAMARAALGETPVRALARHVEDIRTALRSGEDLGFRPVLEGVAEGFVAAERLAREKIPCVVGPIVHPVGGRGVEGTETALGNATVLYGAGVRLALATGGESRRLREQAALAVRYGLPREAALRAVTSTAADLSGAGDRLGRLIEGRDGDFVAFDGDPLEPSSRVLLVVVDGRVAVDRRGEERR